MTTEANFEDGAVVIYTNIDRSRDFTGVVDYSEGEERKGYIRVRQVFSESPDEGNVMHVPASHIYQNG